MLLAIMLLIVGLVLLVYGADRLVYGAAAIARSFGISPMTIGIVIVGVGTSLPELTVAVTASMNYQPDTAVGTVLGSNIANILLILGCAALIRPLSVRSDILKRELPLMLAATLLCGFALHGDQLTLINGVALLAAFGVFLWMMLRIARQATNAGHDPLTDEQMAELPADTSTTVALLWMALGLIMLPLAARIVTDNSIVVARYFGVSELVIALTIIAVGTSLPELATSIAGAIKGEHDMVLGNIIGSNICNILLVLGIPALFFPQEGMLDPNAFARDYWVMLGVSIVLCVLCLRRKQRIGHAAGAVLVCGFIAYVALLFSQHAAELFY